MPKKDYVISDVLYRVRATEYIPKTNLVNPTDTINMQDHNPDAVSEMRSKIFKGTGTNKATKLSSLLSAVEAVLMGYVNGLTSFDGDSIYIEISSKLEEASILIEGNNVLSSAPLNRNIRQSIILLMIALGKNNGSFSETRDIFVKMIDAYNKEDFSTSRTLMFKLCDAFYYELLDIGMKEYRFDDGLVAEMAKQKVRTERFIPIAALEDVEGLYELSVTSAANDSEIASPETSDVFFEECKGGTYMLDAHWDIDRMKYIPDIKSLNEFVPNDTFHTMVSLINNEMREVIDRMNDGKDRAEAIRDNYINCQFVGRPGTGKTMLANALAATFGMPIRVISNSKNTEEDTYQGMTKVQEGGFKFVDTAFLDTFKNGGIILLEEYNLADPGVVMGAIGQAIEKPHILLQDGFEEVKRHPLCIIIATANTGTQGSREPSEAFTSRMPHVFLLDDPEDKEFIEILQKRSGMKKTDCKNVHKVYKRIIEHLISPSVNEEDVALSITLRHCLAALTQMKIGVNIKSAIKNTIIGTIGIKNLQLARDVYQNVVEPMKV